MKPISLDARIADALGNETTTRDTLITLWQSALDAIADAQATIETESANAIDIGCSDPDAAERRVRIAQRTIDRLTAAIPRLKG